MSLATAGKGPLPIAIVKCCSAAESTEVPAFPAGWLIGRRVSKTQQFPCKEQLPWCGAHFRSSGTLTGLDTWIGSGSYVASDLLLPVILQAVVCYRVFFATVD